MTGLPCQILFKAVVTSTFFLALCGCTKPDAAGPAGSKNLAGKASSNQPMTFERMSPLVNDYANIQQILKLSKEESQKLDSVKDKHKQVFKAWYATEWPKLKELEKEFLEAAKERNLKKINQMKSNGKRKQMDQFKQQERKMQIAFEKDLLAAIPENKLHVWKGHRMSELLIEFLNPLDLSKDQIQEIRQLAPAAADSVKREKNWQGIGTNNLEKMFERQILAADQKSDFEALKKKNKLRMLRWKNVSADSQ